MPGKNTTNLQRGNTPPCATALMVGSDYLHQIGSIEKLDISKEEKTGILGTAIFANWDKLFTPDEVNPHQLTKLLIGLAPSPSNDQKVSLHRQVRL